MRLSLLALTCGTALMGACRSRATVDDQMMQDLQAASAATIELAPAGGGRQVVSAIEQLPHAQPKPRPAKSVPAPEVRTPEVAAAAQEPSAQAPRTLPASSVSAPPPGGYKTMGEVLRSAPFPIKP